MKPIVYSLQFRGRVTSSGSDSIRLRSTAPSSAHVTTVGPNGVRSSLEELPGGEAVFESELVLGESSSFEDVGTIGFGRGNVVRFRSAAAGCLAACSDSNLRHGGVVLPVEGG